MRAIARLRVCVEGGTLSPQGGDTLRVEGADAVTLLVAAATDYLPKPPAFRGNPYEKVTADQLAAAAGKSYEALKAAHLAAHQELFRRVRLTLGQSNVETTKLPTDERLQEFAANPHDPALIELAFQYGRYLLISSSRPGDQPANLQGIWTDDRVKTAWDGDYHLDLNLQMNYWAAEACNLPECVLPVVDLVEWMVPFARKTARECYGARGWIAHAVTNPFGYTWQAGTDNRWGQLPGCGAWVMQTLWEHYAFGGDKDYLRRVWPLFKEAGEFWLDWLVPDPATGLLVSGPASSPENRFVAPDGSAHGLCMGPTFDQECVWELFTEILDAAQALGIDDEYVARIREARGKLLGPRIGQDGRLLEWPKEYPEADPRHRHRSHLVALHPGRQITVEGTPRLAEAAGRSLDARGLGGPSWSKVWDACFFARLGQGEPALARLSSALEHQAFANLLTKGGKAFQIDANFGLTAAVAEMLLQSHPDSDNLNAEPLIRLLPALPTEWAEGRVTGLRARGGFTVDIQWKEGKVTNYRIASAESRSVRVRINGDTKIVRSGNL
ncbi:MAG: hypothetical protein NTW86_14605 [Candidatus Sumerlaeota bacterium]|nr:hypothetical protein [Candidatus Sumerlaeota bacterium]